MENLKIPSNVSLYSWDNICRMAEGAAHLSLELKVKDEARGQIREWLLQEGYPDIEERESPEEAIDYFIGRIEARSLKLIRFDKSGNLHIVKKGA